MKEPKLIIRRKIRKLKGVMRYRRWKRAVALPGYPIPTLETVMSTEPVSTFQYDTWYRHMLAQIHIGCYVEAPSSNQWGSVTGVIRSASGMPVCFKVKHGDVQDYISVDRINLWEPRYYVEPEWMYAEGGILSDLLENGPCEWEDSSDEC